MNPRMEWLRRTTGRRTARGIGAALCRSHTTITRWAENGIPAEIVIAVAIRYQTDVLKSLVEVGLLTRAEADQWIAASTLEFVPSDRMTEELNRRAQAARKRKEQFP